MNNNTNASRLPSVSAGRADDFIEYAIRRSGSLYRAGVGTMVIQCDQREAAPSPASALITEHRAFGNEQYKFEVRPGEKLARSLPTGEYTVVVSAPGFEPSRTDVQVSPERVTTIKARLEKRRQKTPSFAERLRKYGLDLAHIHPREISVGEGQRLVLDPQEHDNKRDIHTVPLKTLGEIKAVLGHADDHWPGERAQQLSLEMRAALREYVYGNSKSVGRWEGFLSEWVTLNPVIIGVFVFSVVTVGPGAVLQVGSVGLSCDTLRVHLTGTVEVVGNGPTKIETGTYEEFS